MPYLYDFIIYHIFLFHKRKFIRDISINFNLYLVFYIKRMRKSYRIYFIFILPELFLFVLFCLWACIYIHIYTHTHCPALLQKIQRIFYLNARLKTKISVRTANDNDFALITFRRKININFVNMFRQTWIGACLHYISRMKTDHPDLILSIRLYLSFIYRSNSVRSNEHLCKFGALFAGDFDIIDKVWTPICQ